MKVFLLLLFLSVYQVKGDTPASCLYDDIVGTWTFVESKRIHGSNDECNHLLQPVYSKQLTLSYPNVAKDEFDNVGTWTMVNNQGFEVTISGRSYFAFSKYEGDLTKSVSYCGETMIGWARDLTVRNWSCFRGIKNTEVPPRTIRKFPIRISSNKFRNDHTFISKINSIQKSWRAEAYPENEKYTLQEMMNRAGGPGTALRHPVKPAPVTEEQKQRISTLPQNFDWRNVNGVDFMSPIRDQESCGSCYAFASMGALEARVRILTNNKRQDIFSPQDVVECSRLSQGCAGGFEYLIHGRYAQDQGVVEERCNPYTAEDGPCSTDPSCRRMYVSDYDFVGGYFGACNEEQMIIDLISGGPMPIGLMVYDDFFYYSGGVYKHIETLHTDFNPLVPTNHAVLLVGFGVDEATGEKYWICKNSWGESFGEEGYFKILRGVNECSIESEASISTPMP